MSSILSSFGSGGTGQVVSSTSGAKFGSDNTGLIALAAVSLLVVVAIIVGRN